MATGDVYLVLRRGREDEVMEGSFATLSSRVGGVPLRMVLPGSEWATTDGDTSVILLRDEPAVTG